MGLTLEQLATTTDPEEKLKLGKYFVDHYSTMYQRCYPSIPSEVCNTCMTHIDEQVLREYGNSPSVCLMHVRHALEEQGYPIHEWEDERISNISDEAMAHIESLAQELFGR